LIDEAEEPNPTFSYLEMFGKKKPDFGLAYTENEKLFLAVGEGDNL